MTLTKETKKALEKALELSDLELEDFLEQFDIEPADVLTLLYEQGLIDPELFERLYV